MITIVKTNSENKDFISLVNLLDTYLKEMDGEEHDFYNQYNNIAVLNNVILAYQDNKPVGCGAFKEFNKNSVEIKRMYILTETRNQGVAGQILKALENWAKELQYNSCILETGKRQLEAVRFYKKNNYKIIASYGQYLNIENSLCFEKELI